MCLNSRVVVTIFVVVTHIERVMLVSRCFLRDDAVFVDNLFVYLDAGIELAMLVLVMRSLESGDVN